MPGISAAQQTMEPGDSIYQIRLGDGSRSYGRIIEVHDDRIVFESITGVRMEVNRAFARLQPARGRLVDGEFWPEDRHTTRLFFAPTGRTLGAGDGYAGLFLILPFVGYGVTEDVTFAGGIPLIGSLDQVPIWIAPKVRVHDTPGSQISVGVFGVYLPDEPTYDYDNYDPYGERRRDPADILGVAYGVGTFGDRDNALHVGAGIAFGTGDTEVPVMLGGEIRTSRRHKLISENWLLPLSGVGMITGGIRFLGNRWTTDLGWATIIGISDAGEESIPYFPIVSFSYAFGGGR